MREVATVNGAGVDKKTNSNEHIELYSRGNIFDKQDIFQKKMLTLRKKSKLRPDNHVGNY
jgi:hypothetical protein